jgi:serine/threonine protein kinase
MNLTPGRRLGRFEIVESLGAGGMGEVYRARDTRLSRDVALKVLPEAVAADAHRLERFERETKVLAALSHPNIVTIYSVEDIESVRFFTMELVEGTALTASAGLPLQEIFAVAIPVADALGAAHEKGIVHRDLKPANVMVDRHGRVKVLDFGLAKAALHGATDASATRLMTEAGVVFGTVPYMAPEQISGQGNDARADVFSFGVLLHELATGVRPFTGDSSPELMSAILRDVPPPLTEKRPDLPQHLARIVRRCLEKSPSDRYQTMREVERELRDLKKETDSVAAPVDCGECAAAAVVLDRGAPAESGAERRGSAGIRRRAPRRSDGRPVSFFVPVGRRARRGPADALPARGEHPQVGIDDPGQHAAR